jgi:hypothetical protein
MKAHGGSRRLTEAPIVDRKSNQQLAFRFFDQSSFSILIVDTVWKKKKKGKGKREFILDASIRKTSSVTKNRKPPIKP